MEPWPKALMLTPPSMDTAQRWTVTDMATSIQAVRMGYGFAWLPEEKIREELGSNTLKPLPLREGRERYAELSADPATVRDILRRSAAEITPIARRTADAAKRAMGGGSSA